MAASASHVSIAASSARLPVSHPPARCPVQLFGLVISAASLVLALRAVEAQQALRELGDALMEIRC